MTAVADTAPVQAPASAVPFSPLTLQECGRRLDDCSGVIALGWVRGSYWLTWGTEVAEEKRAEFVALEATIAIRCGHQPMSLHA